MSNPRSRFRVFRDLICDEVCYRCSRPLTAYSAIIVYDDANNQFIYGPHCARKECTNWGIENLRNMYRFYVGEAWAENKDLPVFWRVTKRAIISVPIHLPNEQNNARLRNPIVRTVTLPI